MKRKKRMSKEVAVDWKAALKAQVTKAMAKKDTAELAGIPRKIVDDARREAALLDAVDDASAVATGTGRPLDDVAAAAEALAAAVEDASADIP